MEANIATRNFDSIVNNFEMLINEVFSGNYENQKTKLLKRFEEFNTVVTLYKNSKVYYLPNEIWMKILGYLPTYDILKNFNLACKQFHFLAINPGAIKSLELKNVDESGQYQEIAKVLKRSKTLKELIITLSSKTSQYIYC